MDLNRMPRPAKDAKHTKLSMLRTDGSVPCFNIFKQKRAKGWWPLVAKDDEGDRLVVSVASFNPSDPPPPTAAMRGSV